MSRILIRNAMLLATQDDVLGEIPGGDVLVDGKIIAEVGRNLKAEADEVIDAGSCLVLPGFVNTHHHFYQVLTRCLPQVQDAKLFDWLVYLYEVWKHLSAEDLYAASRAALSELLLTGCTQSADHHYLCPQGAGDLFEAEAKAAAELGIRLHMTRGSMSLGKSAGGLPPDSVIQDEDTILNDSQRVVERFHDPNPQAMCQVALAPCSPFSVTSELMRSVADLARKLGVRLHTHLAETLDEEKFCMERFGKRPLAAMEELGWVGPDVWFAHCVHMNQAEIEHMAETGTGVAHCPVSNLRLGSGIAPIPAMLEAGVPVGLAVDGSASNDSSNMLREVQTAMLVHRVGTGVDAMSARKAIKMATVGSSKVLGRKDTGRIAVGMSADLALFDLSGLAYAGAQADPLAALMFCGMGSRAELVMVNGQVVVRERQLVNADEHKVAEQAFGASKALLLRAGIN